MILPTLAVTQVNKNDVLLHTMAGGGGWGNPLDRDPELVRDDVRSERLTADYVKSEYGVVIDPVTSEIDHNATTQIRDRLKKQR